MPNETISCDCLVVGAGPAGLSAAIAAAETGRNVILCEYLPSPGRKLLASGAGKCNVTNLLPLQEFATRFRCGLRFVRPALYAFPPEALRNFLLESGVPTVAPDNFHCFPKSMRAGDVLDAFLRRLQRWNIRLIADAPITSLTMENGRIWGAKSRQHHFKTSNLILACGGLGYPALGGRGSGYELARQAGHSILPPVPALVGLRSAEPWATQLPGILLPNVSVRFGKKITGHGELIFTHNGVSGPAVLDLSGSVAQHLLETAEATIECSWLSRGPAETLAHLETQRKQDGTKQLKTLLAKELPNAFAVALCAVAGLPTDLRISQLKSGERDRLITTLAACPLRINATEGWNKAMATAGGVPINEVNAGTLGSRICKGLFFAGEMLDVGAPCGGYNIQWAISSGRLAGCSL